MVLPWSSVRRRCARSCPLPERPLSTRLALGTLLLALLGTAAHPASARVPIAPGGTPAPQAGLATQTITFPALPAPTFAGTTVALAATATSGLPVTFTVLSGPAAVTGSVLTLTAPGTVVLQADQPGNTAYSPAPPQQQTITATVLTTALGSTSPVLSTVVTFTAAGTLATPAVLTLGAPNADFALAPGGTCTPGTAYTAGDTCTLAFTFTPSHPGLRLGGISLPTATGTLLGNGYVFAIGNGPQVSFLPATQTTLGVSLGQPSGVAVDGHGNLFVSSLTSPGLFEVTGSTTGTGLGTFPEADDVAVDGSGDVFVISNRTTLSELVAVGGTLPANPVIRTLGTGFQALNGITVDGSGDVFLASGFQGGAASAVSEVLAVNGAIPPAPTIRTLPGSFGGPTGVAVDVFGDVFVSDEDRSAVYEIEAANGVIPAAPTIRQLGSGFSSPSNVSVDSNGNVFVADYGNRVAKEIVAVNGTIPATNPIILTLGSGLSTPQGLALDASGNLLIADSGQPLITRVDTADPPSLTFATTPVGLTSTDSPQTVTLRNSGNAPLIFQPPTAGHNPSISPGFTLGNSSICPLLTPGTASARTLTPGAACTDVVSFTPVTPGTDNGTLLTTDNALSSSGGNAQAVHLHAVGLAVTLTAALTATPTPVFLQNPVTLTATIASNAAIPAGTVIFAEAGTALGSATLNNGIATLTLSTLSLGPHAITASYSSPALGAVTSAPVSVLVEDFRLTLTNAAAVIPHGGTATYTLTVTPIGGPTMPAPITFSTTGSPDFSPVTFSPQPVPAGSGTTPVTLTIQTPNFPVGPWARNTTAFRSRALTLAAFCLALPFARRRHRSARAAIRVLSYVVLFLASFATLTALSGCGSGWRTQSYTFTITGSAGPLTHAVTATLTSQ